MTAMESITDEAREAVERLLLNDDGRTVHQRMVAIIDELPAIGKTQRNEQQKFMFRGHDDVMNALNPLLAKHGVFIVPHVLERVTAERITGNQKTMYEVNLHVEFTFYGAAGDSFAASGWGEGTDMGDKSTSKAMTMAFKYVVAQAFALATADTSDADAGTPEETTRGNAAPAPRQPPSDKPAAFDPGRQLMAGAITVKNEEDATAVRQAQRDLAPNEDWALNEEILVDSLFQSPSVDMSPAQWGEFWKRLANAVAKAYEKGDFPPPSREEVQAAYAWAFKGHVLGLESLVTPFEGTTEAATPEAEKPAETEA